MEGTESVICLLEFSFCKVSQLSGCLLLRSLVAVINNSSQMIRKVEAVLGEKFGNVDPLISIAWDRFIVKRVINREKKIEFDEVFKALVHRRLLH